MYKRLLALLVFIPMFLIAAYVRNSHQSASPAPDSTVTENHDRRDPSDPYPAGHASRGARARDEDRDRVQPEDGDGGSRTRSSRADKTSREPGVFDFYLLNLSWSPEFCATHPGKPECDAHSGFVLHGLWPQNNDGSYPEHCSDAPGPADPSAYRDLYPDAGLLRHEWSVHGTCSGLSADSFFAHARSAVRAVTIPPAIASLDHPTAATPEDVLMEFSRANPGIPRDSFALSCGNNYLTAVEVCLDHDLHAVTCSNIRSCRANSIRIVPPGASGN